MHLSNLLYLDLTSLKVKSGDLSPLTFLKKLIYLDISSEYSAKEFAKVYAALKTCDHGIGPFKKGAELCKKCMNESNYRPWAKGKRAVCKNCSIKRYNAIHEEFYSYVKEFSVE